MRLIFFGTPEFAVLPLKTLLSSGHDVLAVVTQPDRRSGRGRHLIYSPVKHEALKAGLRIFQPQKVRAPDFTKKLETLNPSIIIVVAFGQFLPSEIIHLPKFGCVNIHASLLPKYRGAVPINWAIIRGDEKTGITTMLMDEGMDTGPVLLQQETEIKADDTTESLSYRLSKIGADILSRTLKGLEEGVLKPMHQKGDVLYAPLLRKTDGLIQWSKSAIELCNFIRGMNPWPGAYSFLDGERIKIFKAVSISGDGQVGVIDKVGKYELLVGTGKDILSILEIQRAGKPVMTVKAFLQGRRLKEGMKFCDKQEA